MAAILHTSVLAPHLEPKITSGDRYWRVWMSFVKWCDTQQAFPKSAILTLMIAPLRFLFFVSAAVLAMPPVLSREIPDTSFVRISLDFPKTVSTRTGAAGQKWNRVLTRSSLAAPVSHPVLLVKRGLEHVSRLSRGQQTTTMTTVEACCAFAHYRSAMEKFMVIEVHSLSCMSALRLECDLCDGKRLSRLKVAFSGEGSG